MGLFKKMKDILFDEEEYTEQIKITPEMRNEETPIKVEKREEEKSEVDKLDTLPVHHVEQPKETNTNVSERELFKSDSTFPFFDFDENEFETAVPKKTAPKVETPVTRPTNVMEYERRKKIEKRTDFGRYEKSEVTETVERKKFKPSPIISPVYGILNKDYATSDIVKREQDDKVDVQAVRDKAFGDKKENKEEQPKVTFYEESETVTISEPEDMEKKVKTIDELLEETSDIVVDVDRDLSDLEVESEIMPDKEEKEESITKDNFIEKEHPTNEDTLENDLFDLIDSMYGNDEDGE